MVPWSGGSVKQNFSSTTLILKISTLYISQKDFMREQVEAVFPSAIYNPKGRHLDEDELVVATLLPVHNFKISSASAVWSDSRKMV